MSSKKSALYISNHKEKSMAVLSPEVQGKNLLQKITLFNLNKSGLDIS